MRAYTIVVVAVLFCLERLRPAGRNGVFLAGALLGWLVEGTIVATNTAGLLLSGRALWQARPRWVSPVVSLPVEA